MSLSICVSRTNAPKSTALFLFHGRKRKICLDCKEEADEARDDMVIKLKVGVEENDGKSCLPVRMPLPKDMVTLDDSDQELQTDTSDESEVEFNAADLDLTGGGTGGDIVNNFLKSTFNMYDLKNQGRYLLRAFYIYSYATKILFVRGVRCYKVDYKFFSLTRPRIFKQMGSHESFRYPLQMGV